MTTQIQIGLPAEVLVELDAAVARGSFVSRSAALRVGLELLLREERERAIDDAYRRGYAEHPQEEWVGEAGLILFDAVRPNPLDPN